MTDLILSLVTLVPAAALVGWWANQEDDIVARICKSLNTKSDRS